MAQKYSEFLETYSHMDACLDVCFQGRVTAVQWLVTPRWFTELFWRKNAD